MEKRYRTPLRFASGSGSARNGVAHWWRQRVSAAALIPLVAWLAPAVTHLPDATHAEIMRWLALPWNTLALFSLLLLVFYHAALGIQVVIEDYTQARAFRYFCLVAVQLLLLLLASLAVYALIRIVFKG
jgi:succinate dehydrogenase / fumarate reductase, membrane anchor subunit